MSCSMALLRSLVLGHLLIVSACPSATRIGIEEGEDDRGGEGESRPCQGWPTITWDYPNDECVAAVSDAWSMFMMSDGAVVVRTLGVSVPQGETEYADEDPYFTRPHGLWIEGCGLHLCAHQPDDLSTRDGLMVTNPPLSLQNSHHGFANVWSMTTPTHRVSVMNHYVYDQCDERFQEIEIVGLESGEVFEDTSDDLFPGCP